MSRSEMKALIERLHAIWNEGNLDAIPEVYAEDFVVHWPAAAGIAESRGHDGIRTAIAGIRAAFPDWHEAIVDMVIDGDRVATRYASTGTHRGEFVGHAATGRRVEIAEMSFFRIAAGRVAEQWCLVDGHAMRQQLGL